MMRKRSVRGLGFLVAGLVLATCPGCLTRLFDGRVLSRDDIEARDQDGLFPSIRASLDVLPNVAPPRAALIDDHPPAAPSGPGSTPTPSASGRRQPVATTGGEGQEARTPPRAVRPSLSLQAEYAAGVGGDDEQSIVNGYLDYDNERIESTPTIRHRFDLHLGNFGVRGGVRFYDRIALEGLGGVSVSALRLRVRAPGIQIQDSGVAIGAHIGGRITVTPVPALDLFAQGRIHLLGALQDSRRRVTMGTAMVGGDLHVTRNLSLFGGWRWWRYSEDIRKASDVDDLQISGPTFGTLLRF